jgi:hypothetical protein
VRRRDQSALRAIVGAVALNVLIRSELDGFLGLSALIGVSVSLVLFVVGVRRRPSVVRRRAWIGAAATGAFAVVALAGLTVSAVAHDPTSPMASGSPRRRSPRSTTVTTRPPPISSPTHPTRSATPTNASGVCSPHPAVSCRQWPRTPPPRPTCQRQRPAGTADAAAALRAIDPASLTVVDGTIDLDAIEAVEAPLLQVQAALEDLRRVTVEADSPWLLDAIQDELADLDVASTRTNRGSRTPSPPCNSPRRCSATARSGGI